MALPRYNRQERIEGWNQERLGKVTLTVIGDNPFSNYLVLAGSALGIGTTRLIATPYDGRYEEIPLLKLSRQGRHQERLEEMARNVGRTRLDYTAAHMRSRAEEWFLQGSDFVVDASGRHESRALTIDYFRNGQGGFFGFFELVHFYHEGFTTINSSENPFRLDVDSEKVDPVCAIVAAGSVLEEIKKGLFGIHEPREPVIYVFPNGLGAKENYSDMKVLVVGAGGIGTFVVPALVGLGIGEIVIMDPDNIEVTNLNRQLPFYGAVGKPKASVLAEKFSTNGDGPKITPIIDRFERGTTVRGYDIVFDCVDSFTTRAALSRKCVRSRVPLISGGTSYDAGQVVVYVPGQTSCPNHVLDLDELAEKEQERQRKTAETGRCILQPDPSVIMSNQVTAGMMVNEMRRTKNPDIFGNPFDGQRRYSSIGLERFGEIEMEELCGD